MMASSSVHANGNQETESSNILSDTLEDCHSHVIPASPYFTIQQGSKGRGLFAKSTTSHAIPRGVLLHVAPTLSISAADYKDHMQYTILEHYLFKHKSSGSMLLALGYGSLFNHSRHPNVDYRIDKNGDSNGSPCIRFYSSSYRQIAPGDELCISYGSDLWFDDASDDDDDDDENDADSGKDKTPSDDSADDNPADFLSRMRLDDDTDNDEDSVTREIGRRLE